MRGEIAHDGNRTAGASERGLPPIDCRKRLCGGRDGDMIKTGNSNVSPAEVELEMQSLEGVHNAYVVGLPDKERGQIVVAAVVPRDGVTLDLTDIEVQLRKRLSSYKVPRRVLFVQESDLELTASNKVKTAPLRELAARRLAQG